MQRFARLLDDLVTTQSRNRKLALLGAYFRATPDPDRGWALAVLTDGLPLRFPLRRVLGEILPDVIDPTLYRLSRDYVGDTAETVSLLWPDSPVSEDTLTLGEAVDAFRTATPMNQARLLAGMLDKLQTSGRFALLKLVGGAPRVGVSARLAKQALANAYNRDIADVEEIWHAVEAPYRDLFAWLSGEAPRPDPGQKPVFRPLMLAHPIEDEDWKAIDDARMIAEWKWDGIRVQISAKPQETRIYSRTGDEITKSFPEIAEAYAGRDVVLDGELLVVRDGAVAPFNDLQQRLGRKTVSAKMIRDFPAHVRLYDILFDAGEDLRSLAFSARRQRLDQWHSAQAPERTDLSQLVAFDDFEHLRRIWEGTRGDEIEGLMLKHADSPYIAGRPKGHWWKWKRAPLTLDCVLMYAQRGSGKRSSFYSDYTFGVWTNAPSSQRAAPPQTQTPSTAGDAGTNTGRDPTPENAASPSAPPQLGELVPVGKAYSGFTDEELTKLDRFIRNHTTDRFGPVRAVEPRLVFEVAFDAVQPSARHKSGIAMRFPRIARIRWDKPAEEADTLAAIQNLLPQGESLATTESANE